MDLNSQKTKRTKKPTKYNKMYTLLATEGYSAKPSPQIRIWIPFDDR